MRDVTMRRIAMTMLSLAVLILCATVGGGVEAPASSGQESLPAYPAISTDAGIIWRIDGPLFHVDALQGASVITNVGSLGTDGAYYWGRGGNVVWVTTDGGSRWWLTGFSYGVNRVTASHGTLRTIALGRQLKGGEIESFLYTSNDSGHTWELRGRLANLRS